MRSRLAQDSGGQAAALTPTSMIDVTFLLLIFFLCTLRFKTLDQKLEAHLPREEGAASGEEAPSIEVRIRVLDAGTPSAAGDAWDGGHVGRRVAYDVGPVRFAEADAAAAHLRDLCARLPGRRLVLAATPGVLHGEVVALIDAGLVRGLPPLSILAPAP